MNRINIPSISVLISVILIPQLLFWWLAPVSADARLTVLIFGSLVTTVIPITAFIVYCKSDIRRAAGFFIAAALLEIAAIGTGFTLLLFKATGRSVFYAYIIMVLISVIVLIPMAASIFRFTWFGVGDDLNESIYDDSNEYEEADSNIGNYDINHTISYTSKMQPVAQRPLPSRNR